MLRPSDSAAPGREPVVVLSHAAWMRLFGGDPAAVGQQLRIRGVYVEIVGIAPEGFVGLDAVPRDFWAPLTMLPALEEGPGLFGPEQPQRLDVVGRLGATETQAPRVRRYWPGRGVATASNPPETRPVVAILDPAATPIALSFNVLLAFMPLVVAFGLVLLTAAANLAGLMLSRATARQREIAIRLSLGASRGRIVRQLFVESLLLALVGSLAGFALGRVTLDAGIRAVYATLPPAVADYIRLLPVVPDAHVLAVLIAAGIGSCRPVRRPARAPRHAPRWNDRVAWRHARRADVAAPSWSGRRADHRVGAAHHHVRRAAARVSASGHDGPRAADARCHRSAHQEPIQRDRARHVAHASPGPHGCRSVGTDVRFRPDGDRLGCADRTDSAAPVRMPQKLVSPGYFDMYEIGLVSGHTFTEAEASAGAPVVILSQQAAATLWPGQNALGRLVRLAQDSGVPDAYRPPSPVVEVVGVARTVLTSWDEARRATIYSPMPVTGSNLNMLVKNPRGQCVGRDATDRRGPERRRARRCGADHHGPGSGRNARLSVPGHVCGRPG